MTRDPQPKAVLFDLGKVLIDFDWSIGARRIAALCKYHAPELLERMIRSPLMPRYERGQINSREFFQEARRAIEYRGTFEDFAAAFAEIFSEIPEMTALHARVRAAGFRTWIFSNTNDLAVGYIRRTFPFFSNFDGYFLSYELGKMKPEAGIYEEAERATGCRGPEIFYIDDFAENVAGGAARGWQAVLHATPAETIAKAEQVLQLAHHRRAGVPPA
jgi:glucose-1-phosphatase